MHSVENNLRVARLGASDMAEVARLEALCFSLPWSEEQLQKALSEAHFIVYGLRLQGELLAYLSVFHLPGELEVLNVATHPKARRRGYARRLLELALSIARHLNLERAVLEVRQYNAPAQHLYAQLGFQQVGIRKKYYTDTGEDALVMSYVCK